MGASERERGMEAEREREERVREGNRAGAAL